MSILDTYIDDVVKKVWGDKGVARKIVKEDLEGIIDRRLGTEPDDIDVTRLLEEKGHPSDVALRYNIREREHIARSTIESYILILRLVTLIVLTVITVVSLVGIIFTPISLDQVISSIFQMFPRYLKGIIYCFGVVGIVSLLMYRFNITIDYDIIPKRTWDSNVILHKYDDILKKRNLAIKSIACFVVILGLLLIWDKIGIYTLIDKSKGWSYQPIFKGHLGRLTVYLICTAAFIRAMYYLRLLKEGKVTIVGQVHDMINICLELILLAVFINYSNLGNILEHINRILPESLRSIEYLPYVAIRVIIVGIVIGAFYRLIKRGSQLIMMVVEVQK